MTISTTTTIAILGSGRVATSLATGFAKAGYQLVIGARKPDEARLAWKGPDAVFAMPEAAIAAAEIVFNATPGDTSVARLGVLADALGGKLLIDVANATGRDNHGRPLGLLYPDDSLAERLQNALPETRVVKTLNTMLAPVMSNPGMLTATPTAFLSGNDADAKATVRALLTAMGWNAGSILDLGGIETARGPEAVMLMVPDIMKASGFTPFAVSVVR
jgi:predicted dinucleotide-binding enzyme